MAIYKIVLCSALMALVSSFSMDSLRGLVDELVETKEMEKKEVTFQEYLDGLEEPHPLFRRANPNTFCKRCPAASFPTNKSTCQSGRWKPDYVTHDSGCACLSTYKCCSDGCQPVDVKACWRNGGKGLKYGVLETDCCDCQVVKCVDCQSTTPEEKSCPRGQGARPTDCYDYTKNYEHAKDTGCWLSHCTEKKSDAINMTCQSDCQDDKTVMTHCQFPQNECENTQELGDCPNRNVATATKKLTKPKSCYHQPVESADAPSGHYFDKNKDTCEVCKKWTYKEISCRPKNEAANNEDCHEYGEHLLNRKCFRKNIVKDNCGCNLAQCLATSERDPEVFDPKDNCPKNHVKISGASLCMKQRDLCKQCPVLVPIKPTDCPNGNVVEEKDSNGCKVSKCQLPTVPAEACACKKYVFDANSKKLSCDCANQGGNSGPVDSGLFQNIMDGWTLIQYHDFLNVDAFKNKKWNDYANGFYSRGEFWVGLKKMHQLTQSGSWHLKVEVKFDVNRYGKLAPRHGKWGMGEWNNFKVASELQGFKLTIGKRVKQQNLGSADVWQYSRNRHFSTADRGPSTRCATRDGGGWWHSHCYWFCGNCQRSKTLGRHMLWYDGFGKTPRKEIWDFPSITKMWIKKAN